MAGDQSKRDVHLMLCACNMAHRVAAQVHVQKGRIQLLSADESIGSKRSPDGAAAKSGAVEDTAFCCHAAQGLHAKSTRSRLPKKNPPFSFTPFAARLYCGPSLPPRGRCLDRLGRVGRERRPRRSGPARRSPRRDNGPDPSRGSPPPPLRHYDRSAQWGLKKRGMETFRRRVGAPVRRDFTSSAKPALPHPSSRPGPSSGRRTARG
jgi:hypothetical protein